MNCILVTGGAGFIGSHTCVALLNDGYSVVIYDNFSNAHRESVAQIEKITEKKVTLIEGDVRDQALLEATLKKYACDGVIHFAGLKAVGESVTKPLDYYENNVAGTLCLLRAMQNTNVRTLVFSSSATVYGNPQTLPLKENHPLSTTNPYGHTKLIIEDMLRAQFAARPDWKIGILRYFNPVGADKSGLIGEDPNGLPNNLMPYIAQVAIGLRPCLKIWGDDYPTADGTGVRDYIHVVDLALGHVKALGKLQSPQCFTVNLGSGHGYSVLEVVRAFELASGKTIPYEMAPRRTGDIAACYADVDAAFELLGWKAERGMEEMCRDHWHWQQKNPTGFKKSD